MPHYNKYIFNKKYRQNTTTPVLIKSRPNYNRHDYNEKEGVNEMELHSDIVRQLYSEIHPGKTTDGKSGRGLIGFSLSAKPPCLKAFYHFFATVDEAFPDYTLFLDNMVAKGNKVLTRYTISGNPKGDFMGLTAVDEQITITGIDVFLLDKGNIVEYWNSAHQVTASQNKTWHCPNRPLIENITTITQRKQTSLSA
jgi:predicted ester cyclase